MPVQLTNPGWLLSTLMTTVIAAVGAYSSSVVRHASGLLRLTIVSATMTAMELLVIRQMWVCLQAHVVVSWHLDVDMAENSRKCYAEHLCETVNCCFYMCAQSMTIAGSQIPPVVPQVRIVGMHVVISPAGEHRCTEISHCLRKQAQDD